MNEEVNVPCNDETELVTAADPPPIKEKKKEMLVSIFSESFSLYSQPLQFVYMHCYPYAIQ